MAPGLPHLPAPEDPKRASEKRCAGCGCWNHPDEIRCQRCGRKLESLLGADGRRELEETESLPGPAIPIAAASKPSPEPEWKEELSRRLAGYRERQAERSGASEDEATQTAGTSPPLPRLPYANKPEQDEQRSLPPPRRADGAAPLPAVRIEDPFEEDGEPPRRAEVVGKPRPTSARIFDKLMESQGRLPLRSPRPPVEALVAPINKRFIAGLLDLCVVALALGVFVAVTHLLNQAILRGPGGMTLVAGAFAVLLALYWIGYLRLLGSTAGMHWTGLRVLNLDGEPPDDHQRWTRACGTILSAAAMGVGFLWSLFDEQHFTWHDRLSKTFVARER